MLQFWDVVVECLVEFHKLDCEEAYQKTIQLRKRLSESDRLEDGVYPSEIVYHEEPFQLACDLMANKLNAEEHWETYIAILGRHGW